MFGEGDRNHRIAVCPNSVLERMCAAPKAQATQFVANVQPIIRDAYNVLAAAS